MEIIVSNVADFYSPVTELLPAHAAAYWQKASFGLGQYALYWGGGEKLVVVECEPAASLVAEICARAGYARAEVRVPGGRGRTLLEKITGDGSLMETMADMAEEGADLAVWGRTGGMDGLAGMLGYRDCGAGPGWLHAAAGSKCGARLLFAGSKVDGEPLMPEGTTAENLAEAASEAGRLLSAGWGAVVKSDMGTAGYGMVFFEPGRKTGPGILRRLKLAARGMPELEAGLVAVERFVPDEGGRMTSASVQCELSGREGWKICFTASHHRGNSPPRGLATGPAEAGMGRGALPRTVRERLACAASVVCEKLCGLGYAGVAGMDFALEGGEGPRLLEINARRTTLTAGAELARWLYGSGWEEKASVRFHETGSLPRRTLDGLSRALRETLYPAVLPGGGTGGWLPLPAPGERGREDFFTGAVAVAPGPDEASMISDLLRG